MEWISVKDRKPVIGEWVVVILHEKRAVMGKIIGEESQNFYYIIGFDECYYYILDLYLPIPPPKEECDHDWLHVPLSDVVDCRKCGAIKK